MSRTAGKQNKAWLAPAGSLAARQCELQSQGLSRGGQPAEQPHRRVDRQRHTLQRRERGQQAHSVSIKAQGVVVVE